jgi:copper chaperone CopZ
MGPAESKPSAKAIFSLFNLGCSGCSGIIERKLRKVSGIKNVTVNYVTDTVLVNYDPGRVTTEDIRAFMKKLGYDSAERHHGA